MVCRYIFDGTSALVYKSLHQSLILRKTDMKCGDMQMICKDK